MTVTDPDVLDDGLQVLVVVKHGGQAGAVPARLVFKLVVDDGPARPHTHTPQLQYNARLCRLIDLLKASSPVNRTRSPPGFSLNQILQKLNRIITIQNMPILQK